jgi:hypothetical protein
MPSQQAAMLRTREHPRVERDLTNVYKVSR